MSTLAKRLLDPDLICPHHATGPDWVLTDGPAVADLCARAGYAPDPQQELGLDLIFAVNSVGLPASFSFCVICCRQNMKTGLFKMAALGWLFLTCEQRIVWSAHEMDTTREAHQDLALLITDNPMFSKYLPRSETQGIYTANGQERIELADGRRLRFKARTLSGGRGLTGNKTILDEAFALVASHVGALIPTMTARPGAQVLYGSSAGKAESAILRDVRDRGRKGSSPRLTYIEWLAKREQCALPDCTHPKDAMALGLDCALDREHLILDANPTISTGRISVQTIRDIRQELPPEEFMRESLGWWDEEDDAVDVFGPGRWAACASTDPEIRPQTPTCIGVAVSVDRSSASLAASSIIEALSDPDDSESEPEDRFFVAPVDRRPGTGWLFKKMKRLSEKYPEMVFLADAGGPTKNLREKFEEKDIPVEWVDLNEYADACSDMYDKVQLGTLMHPDAAEMNQAVKGAAWRPVGDRQVWGRRQSLKSGKDVSMLEAGTLAIRGAEKYGSAVILG